MTSASSIIPFKKNSVGEDLNINILRVIKVSAVTQNPTFLKVWNNVVCIFMNLYLLRKFENPEFKKLVKVDVRVFAKIDFPYFRNI